MAIRRVYSPSYGAVDRAAQAIGRDRRSQEEAARAAHQQAQAQQIELAQQEMAMDAAFRAQQRQDRIAEMFLNADLARERMGSNERVQQMQMDSAMERDVLRHDQRMQALKAEGAQRMEFAAHEQQLAEQAAGREYTDAQKRRMAELDADIEYIRNSGVFRPEEAEAQVQALVAERMNIEPLPAQLESPWPKGQDFGQVWQLDDGTFVTRGENGEVSRLAESPRVRAEPPSFRDIVDARNAITERYMNMVGEGSLNIDIGAIPQLVDAEMAQLLAGYGAIADSEAQVRGVGGPPSFSAVGAQPEGVQMEGPNPVSAQAPAEAAPGPDAMPPGSGMPDVPKWSQAFAEAAPQTVEQARGLVGQEVQALRDGQLTLDQASPMAQVVATSLTADGNGRFASEVILPILEDEMGLALDAMGQGIPPHQAMDDERLAALQMVSETMQSGDLDTVLREVGRMSQQVRDYIQAYDAYREQDREYRRNNPVPRSRDPDLAGRAPPRDGAAIPMPDPNAPQPPPDMSWQIDLLRAWARYLDIPLNLPEAPNAT